MSDRAMPRFDRATLADVARRAFARAFDPAVNLVGAAPRAVFPAIGYAWLLLDEGTPEADMRADAILRTVLTAQETRPGAPDFGHFRMLFEDETIADLNAVQLTLIELIPVALLYRARLPAPLREALEASVRAGLAALEDIAAQLTYSNVAVLDVTNRILGGQLLGDGGAVARGVEELDAFIAYTNRHGGIRDYNSPTYLGQMLTTLATLANHVADPTVRRKAELLQERIWLQAATHYHPGLAQFAGPYSRAYPPDVTGGVGSMKTILYLFLDDERLLGDGIGLDRLSGGAAAHLATREYFVPAYLLRLTTRKPLPCDVRESSERDFDVALTSHLGREHTLGTATIGFGSQARSVLAHFAPYADRRTRILYSRFLAEGEARDMNLRDTRMVEWGHFAGVQGGGRAIALYGLRPDYRRLSALRVELFLLGAGTNDAPWCDGRRLTPGDRVAAGQWLTLDLGPAYAAIYPLRPTHLGGDGARPVALHADGTDLRLTIDNYDGPAKFFWKYAPLPWEHGGGAIGPFFHGNLRAGFLIETTDASEWGDFEAFRRAVEEAHVSDTVDDLVRRVRWERGGHSLELAVDLHTFARVAHLVDGQPEADVSLQAPGVVQLPGTSAGLDGVEVRSSAPGMWVAVADDGYAVANPTPAPLEVGVAGAAAMLPAFARAMVGQGGDVRVDELPVG